MEDAIGEAGHRRRWWSLPRAKRLVASGGDLRIGSAYHLAQGHGHADDRLGMRPALERIGVQQPIRCYVA